VVVLVAEYMYEAYNGFMNGATDEQKAALDAECDSLMLWGERRAQDVTVPERETREVRRVYQLEGGPREVPVEKAIWPLESANKGLLRELDARIVQAYRAMKGVGFERPSIVLSLRYFSYSHTVDRGDKFVENPKAWAGVMLVCQRLEGACRLAVRFEFPERFGPKITDHKDGSWSVEYTKEAWRPALVRRGIVPRKKIGGEDAGRKNQPGRGAMRQVPGAAQGSQGKRRGRGGRGKRQDDVSGAVRGQAGEGQSGFVQGDLSSLSETFGNPGEKNGARRSDKRGKGRKKVRGKG
jgi:hypothetical protein